jgi:hypothetical protein
MCFGSNKFSSSEGYGCLFGLKNIAWLAPLCCPQKLNTFGRVTILGWKREQQQE